TPQRRLQALAVEQAVRSVPRLRDAVAVQKEEVVGPQSLLPGLKGGVLHDADQEATPVQRLHLAVAEQVGPGMPADRVAQQPAAGVKYTVENTDEQRGGTVMEELAVDTNQAFAGIDAGESRCPQQRSRHRHEQ